ncbi:AzlC family ABC transporter permease [Pseudonocardia sp. CA-107938]|uniref:AzlC family ABC transporter permease n=1 Tax=Pseudonocardia sp. CA-107938 TaxID=3240021 RepID=UPI003D926DFE
MGRFWERFGRGIRVGAGIGVATFVLGVTFGALTQRLGWGPIAPVVCSALVFSGSAQFAIATALAGGGGVALAVGAASLINARYVPMGISVASTLHGGPLRRGFEAQALADAPWLAAHQGNGVYDRDVLFGAGITQYPAWVLGSAVGVLTAPPPDIVERFGLDLVFPGFFVVLLLDELRRSRQALGAGVLGGVIASGLLLVTAPGPALIGSAAAAAIGVRGKRKARTAES